MTFQRFKELWDKAGLNNLPKFDNPIMVDGCSPELEAALIKAADGDFSAFDKVDAIMEKMDEGDRAFFCRRTPEETYAYFKKRFAEFATPIDEKDSASNS